MLLRVKKISAVLAVCLGYLLPLQGQAPGPESVVVVANKNVPGSLKVAKAYMSRRSIPDENLILIRSSENEKISREEYLEDIHNPVLRTLLDRELVNAFKGEKDSLGRLTVTVFDNPIRYMVLCYGVPVHVLKKPVEEIDDLAFRRAALTGKFANLVDSFTEGMLARNEASVDGELSLILQKEVPLNGFLPNPFFQQTQPPVASDIIKVTRLDGPSPEAVIRLIDRTLEGEREGLKGRAYVDEDSRKGPYEAGNRWLQDTAKIFESLGYDLQHDTARQTFQADARFDAPVLYAGWYARHVNGPFELPGFRFPTGAVAAHLHSFSASPLRSEKKGWVGPLVEGGVSATFGNVAEPYLTFTHHFGLFFAALARGWNFGDAAYLALPALSWQAVAIGDPLYRPFAVGLDQQLDEVGDPMNILEDQYVILRQANLMEAGGDGDGALKALTRGMLKSPGPALALRKAVLLESVGKKDEALQSLALFSGLKPTQAGDWGLFAELADTLHRMGDAGTALKIYKELDSAKLPESVRLVFLKRGIKVAEDAGESRLAIDWQTRVTPPAPEDTSSARETGEQSGSGNPQ